MRRGGGSTKIRATNSLPVYRPYHKLADCGPITSEYAAAESLEVHRCQCNSLIEQTGFECEDSHSFANVYQPTVKIAGAWMCCQPDFPSYKAPGFSSSFQILFRSIHHDRIWWDSMSIEEGVLQTGSELSMGGTPSRAKKPTSNGIFGNLAFPSR
ncbi:hypothetical protein BJ508DRAFT_419130 [Ascobolus immersus RN42]|uniref:Uncharacterized protein n=1 Tax=Ascobolus immersus RN42 TaxID=1160509 RepID=A0A3N4HU63_ASCIM|nr:hypothetical protein BJ508DRAFT_419130 [Ascobolus immersus RN42]